MIISRNFAVSLCWLGIGLVTTVDAGTGPAPAIPAPGVSASGTGATGILIGQLATGSAWDHWWSLASLYKNDTNPWLQELAIQGQVQTQYAYGSDATGQYGTGDLADSAGWGDLEARRFRLGLKARAFGWLKYHCLLDLYPDLSPRVYKDLAEMYLTATAGDAFNFSVGKRELKFTREQELSSSEYLTFERSQLVNMFYGGELTGAWICGKGLAGGWFYEMGAYANDRKDEWTSFDGGTMILGKIGYNYTGRTSFDLAQAAFHYLHNTEPGYVQGCNAASPNYSDCIAISNDLTKGHCALSTELFWGDGVNGRPDVWGVSAMPTYYLTDKLQLVTTVQWAGSGEANGMVLPTRYEALSPGVGDKRGDAYWAGYAGLNYYFYGHKLKVMSGVKYTYMDGGSGGGDFNGWTWLAGMRMAF